MQIPRTFLDAPLWRDDVVGRHWLDGLVESVAAQCEQWQLDIEGEPRHGSNALVVPVKRADDQFVLRMTPPDGDIATEARALTVWDGRGTVQLVDVDLERSAMLLERLDGSESLLRVPLDEAVPILARTMVELAVPAPLDVPSTSDLAADHVERFPTDWQSAGRPTRPSILERAVDGAGRLSEPSGDLAANGDLHYEQVLKATRAPWLVVDPVLLRGDMHYDLGRVLWSRLDEMNTAADIRRYFDMAVDVAGLPRDCAQDWVICRSMDYLLWGIPRGFTHDMTRCQRILETFA